MLQVPLLNALKTFVVAGHHLNFTKAAEDLLVSPSAVSHQIRVLEDYLGIKLFVRQNRSLALTQEGEKLHTSLLSPFEQISRAVQNVVQDGGRGRLRLALRPFFSSAWLAPRLNAFWGKNPQVEIDLIHTIKTPDFVTENIDLSIIWGKGNWPNLKTQLLIPGNLTPICSRKLIEEKGRPNTPEELGQFTLIHDEDRSAWDAWLHQANAGPLNCQGNLIIDDTNVRVQSILNGQGIMLGCPALLERELNSGELVQLFDTCLDTYAYYLVYPEATSHHQNLDKFIEWITETAA